MGSKPASVIGYDIGGTKIAVSICDSRGNVLACERVPSGAACAYEETLPRLIETGRRLIRECGLNPDDIRACGVASPGPIDVPKGLMLKSPNMLWDAVPIRDDLAEALELPVYFDNDANGGALAEWFFGAAKECRDFIYLTMSTGIGGGVIVNGTLMQGYDGLAGELGHLVLDLDGPCCSCGLQGCLEAYCGGRSVGNRLRHMMEFEPVSAFIEMPEVNGDPARMEYPALREAAKRGIPFAVKMWDEICLRLAQGIGIHIMTFNPEMVVLGTLALYSGDALMNPLREHLRRFVWPQFLDHCHLTVTALGTRIGELAGPSVAFYGLRQQGEWQPWAQ